MNERNLDDIEFARIVLAFSDWVTKWRDPACADRLKRFRLANAVRNAESLETRQELLLEWHERQNA